MQKLSKRIRFQLFIERLRRSIRPTCGIHGIRVVQGSCPICLHLDEHEATLRERNGFIEDIAEGTRRGLSRYFSGEASRGNN